MKFSIIIPVFNIEKYIKKCLDSIINQNYYNYEVLLIDDGSTDNSGKICDNYSMKYENISVYHKKNGGLSDARNYGLKYVSGDYIWFVDGDDYIADNSLEILNNLIKNRKCDIVIFNYNIETNGLIKEEIDRFNNGNKQCYPLLTCSACNKVFNKKYFIDKNHFNFKKGVIYEDLELVPYVVVKAASVEFLDNGLYFYVQRNNSIMNQTVRFNDNRDDKFLVLTSLTNRFKNDKIYNKYENELIFLTIRHLILVYSTEIMQFNKQIYYPRCKKSISYLKSMNYNWFKNQYLKSSSIYSRLFVFLFRMRLFIICKVVLKIFKKI